MTPPEWTPEEQAEHRRVLEAALDGPDPGDERWRELAGELIGNAPTPRVDRPHRPRSEQAKARRRNRSGLCDACRTRRHGPDCAIATMAGGRLARCACTCRAVLGLTEFTDATAPEVADQVCEGAA